MRNSMLPGLVLFYALVALVFAVLAILLRQESVMNAGAEALSNACENLALIAIALGVWLPMTLLWPMARSGRTCASMARDRRSGRTRRRLP